MFRVPRTVIILFLIFAVGLFLRFYKLESFPAGFHVDEASKGYTAYSLLRTGRDDNNHILPVYIDMFGDNSPAGYHYLTIVPVGLFGLSELAVRFPGALFGTLTIFAVYFLAYSISKEKKLSLVSSALLAISPWHIILSRASSESIVAIFFIVLGFALVIWSLQVQKIKYLFLGTAILTLSFFMYQTPRLFVPFFFLMLLIFVFFYSKLKMDRSFKKALLTAFICLTLFDAALVFIVPGGTGRFSQVNIFSYPETRLVMDEQIREDGVRGTRTLVTRVFHNKPIDYSLAYFSNYLSYFSWNFLFMNGLPSIYFVTNTGVFYLAALPFVILGLFSSVNSKNRLSKLPLLWLLIGPLAAATAIDVNNLQRAATLFIIGEIITAYGIIYIHSRMPAKKFITVLVIVVFLANGLYFLHEYFIHSPVHRPWYRDNGTKELVALLNKSYNSYDKIIMTKSFGGYPLFQFFMQYDPLVYQQEGSPKDAAYKGFGKFYFVPVDCPSVTKNLKLPPGQHLLFVNKGQTCKADLRFKEDVIYRTDRTEAFRVVYGDKQIEKQ